MSRSRTIPLFKVNMPPGADAVLSRVLYSGTLAEGEWTYRFEESFGRYIGNPLVVSAGDVSTAATVCLFLAGVRPGDRVLASPMACLETNMPILNLFAEVVWCDVDPLTGNLHAGDIERRITDRVKAIVYSHWAGDPADIDAINAVARRHGLRVVEDASEALGAEYRDRKVGNSGSDFVVFSFYANRHITTGEGAAITFGDAEEADRARWIKRYGIHRPSFRDALGEINPKSDIPTPGYNSYMTNLAGALGTKQLEGVDSVVRRHQDNATFYERALDRTAGITPLRRPSHSRSAYWVYTFLAERRDDLLKRLREHGIHASKVHVRNDVYSCFGPGPVDYPGLEAFSTRCLSIPCGWWMTEEDRAYIVDAIRQGW